ncbi:unnamed protein product [Protopolystoma xenopodis]|uniref:Uncharacterized protein n=1 Tax=Protopolystoma xenopodis TaxID=117903 RepID=A0A3S5BGQ7_9PLAT|nr:unnamed protein product [Protopolystoma xenopodis]
MEATLRMPNEVFGRNDSSLLRTKSLIRWTYFTWTLDKLCLAQMLTHLLDGTADMGSCKLSSMKGPFVAA